MTAQEVFEAIKVRAERASGIQGAFKFIVDGDKVVHVDAHQTPVQVSMEDKPADCTVRLTSDTLEGPLDWQSESRNGVHVWQDKD